MKLGGKTTSSNPGQAQGEWRPDRRGWTSLYPVWPQDWLPEAPSSEGTLGAHTQKMLLGMALTRSRPCVILKKKEKVQIKMGKGRESGNSRKQSTTTLKSLFLGRHPHPYSSQFTFFFPHHNPLVHAHSMLAEQKLRQMPHKQNQRTLRRQTGLRGRQSTAQDQFQMCHDGSAYTDEMRSVASCLCFITKSGSLLKEGVWILPGAITATCQEVQKTAHAAAVSENCRPVP